MIDNSALPVQNADVDEKLGFLEAKKGREHELAEELGAMERVATGRRGRDPAIACRSMALSESG